MRQKAARRRRSGLLVLAVAGTCVLGSAGVLAAVAFAPGDAARPAVGGNSVERATRFLQQGRLAAAKAIFLEEIKRDPKSVEAVRGLATCAREAGNDEEAIQYFERLVALAPKDFAARRSLAILYHSAGGRDFEAMSELQAAMALAPKEESAEMSRLIAKLAMQGRGPADPLAGLRGPAGPRPGGPVDPTSRIPRPEPPDPTKRFLQQQKP